MMKDIKNKLNLQGIIGDIKSMISPAGNTPDPDPSDAIGIKLAKLSVMVQELQAAQLEHSKKLGEINVLFNEVYQHLQAAKVADNTKASVTDKPEQGKESEASDQQSDKKTEG